MGRSKNFFIKIGFALAFVLLKAGLIFAQERPHEPAKDTSDIYKKIKKYAYKRKFTKFVYENVFRDPPNPASPYTSNSRSRSNKQKRTDPNAKYVGKVIRDIEITVYDPFGHSVNDTLVREVTNLQRMGNRAHITTRTGVVRNLLMFRKNEKVDILKITESERILRQIGYVNDARIYLSETGSKDSVNVRVIVQDRWSWDVSAELLGPLDGEIALRDQNLAGLGHQFQQSYYHDFSDNTYESQSRYNLTNISHTYISSSLWYTNRTDLQQLGLTFDRPFYSPLAKWAGGISGVKTWTVYKFLTPDTVLLKPPLEHFVSDYWIGRSFNTRKSNTIDNRSRNITVAVRYYNITYQKHPSFEIDTNKVFVNTNLYIGSLGYSVRKFYKDRYIYRFGANEDVPEGWLVQGLYGVQDKDEYKLRYYLGFEASAGKHVQIGYVSASYTYGTFFNRDVRKNATMNIGLSYFSDLINIGRWSIRQFVNYKLVYGINKFPGETIILNSSEMYGLPRGPDQKGTRKMILNFQTVMYTPYNLVGFRFAPVLLIGLGMLEPDSPDFFKTPIYQSYATGILIRNENLLASSLQITVGFYPMTPPGTSTHFKVNPIANLTLRVNGFGTPKPSPVSFN